MSTIEDFRNALVGATATRKATGSRVVKIGDDCWMLQTGAHVGDELMTRFGYTLDKTAPTTAQEALDLAWELAYPVKESQHIPEGTRLLDRQSHSHFSAYMTQVDITINEWESQTIRTMEPLPEPLPEWTKAPAVLASVNGHPWHSVWLPKHGGKWVCTCCGAILHWSDMDDVTPPYPKEQA